MTPAQTCVLSPGVYDMCSPASSAKEDATRGEWVRIDKDVNRRVGVYYLYIYARASHAPLLANHPLLKSRTNPRPEDRSSLARLKSQRHHRHPLAEPLCPDLGPFRGWPLGRSLRLPSRRRLAAHDAALHALQTHFASRRPASSSRQQGQRRRRAGAHHGTGRVVRFRGG
jgi:hypothetical protein